MKNMNSSGIKGFRGFLISLFVLNLVSCNSGENSNSVTSLQTSPMTGAKQVWFTPDIASRDMPNLFTQPDLWASAQNKINVFKFYVQQLTATDPSQCTVCGSNLLPAMI